MAVSYVFLYAFLCRGILVHFCRLWAFSCRV